jgi:(R,R)-butanediol dehydrogenase / meso-butanediol dehydrogenase / diacetyl reductase
MKAAVIYGAKDVRVQEVPEPVVSSRQVKVQIAYAGICGSDLHAYHHGIGLPMDQPAQEQQGNHKFLR